MFVSMPEFRFQVPQGLGPRGAQYWRTLTTSTNSAWFILKLKLQEADGVGIRTFLFWWDQDVAQAIEDLQPLRIESLVCVLPSHFDPDDDGDGSKLCVVMSEIWRSHNDEFPDMETILFIDEDGVERGGLFGDRSASPMPRIRLVGRVAAVAPVSPNGG
jgi:hypothetical protein